MLMGIDLHVHSTYSDGSWSVKQILDDSLKKQIPVLALTDHDTTRGIDELLSYSKGKNITIVPGIELSTKLNNEDIHILGYFPNTKSAYFNQGLIKIQEERIERNKKMVELLRENGVDISYDSFAKEYPNHIITRAQFGAYLYKHGFVTSIKEAFKKYVGVDCPCYVPRKNMSVEEGVKFLKKSNALVYIAHPGLYHLTDIEFEDLVKRLIPLGLTGIECYHSSHTSGEITKYRTLAKKYNLLSSGGSDFHADNKPGISLGIGRSDLYVPYHLYEEMLSKLM